MKHKGGITMSGSEKSSDQLKQDMIDFVSNMKIKKSGMGGFDKSSVYQHIQEIIKMNDNYVEKRLEEERAASDYRDNISTILSEARREGERMIGDAQAEVEKEMVKLLNIRARFKHDSEVYESWCARVHQDEKELENSFTSMTLRYAEASRMLASMQIDMNNLSLQTAIFRPLELSEGNLVERIEERAKEAEQSLLETTTPEPVFFQEPTAAPEVELPIDGFLDDDNEGNLGEL